MFGEEIQGDERTSLILMATFWVIWKERIEMAFEGKSNFVNFKDFWFQILNFFIKGGHLLYSNEKFRDPLDILINL